MTGTRDRKLITTGNNPLKWQEIGTLVHWNFEINYVTAGIKIWTFRFHPSRMAMKREWDTISIQILKNFSFTCQKMNF